MITKYSVLEKESFLHIAGIDDAYTKYYSKIPREVFNQIVAADPSLELGEGEVPKKLGKFGQWLLKMYTTGKLKLEDLYKATEDLEVWQEAIPTLKKDKKPTDINQFKTPQELYLFAKENKTSIMPSPDEVETNADLLLSNQYFLKNNKATLHYEDENFKIIEPLTLDASEFYAAGTRWCTQYPDNFRNYSSKDTLFILIGKKHPAQNRFQFHFAEQQFMDTGDSPIDLPEFFRRYPAISEFFKSIYFDEEAFDEALEQIPRNDNGDFLLELGSLSELTTRQVDGEINVDKWMDGETIDYDVDYSDIYKYVKIDDANLETLRSWLETNCEEEIADEDLSLETESDVKEAIKDLEGAYELRNAIAVAYTMVYENNLIDAVQETIKSVFTDVFNYDFSKWYPGERIAIPEERLKITWFNFIGYTVSQMKRQLSDFSSVVGDTLEVYGEREFIRYLRNAIEGAENHVYVEDKDLNESLAERLQDL